MSEFSGRLNLHAWASLLGALTSFLVKKRRRLLSISSVDSFLCRTRDTDLKCSLGNSVQVAFVQFVVLVRTGWDLNLERT